MEHKEIYHTESLEACIRHRHSIRFYTDQEVPKQTLLECCALAQLSPSNSNIQNWRVHFASGAARDRIVAALMAEAKAHGPNVPPLPETFKHFRSDLGHDLYGENGYNVPRKDKEAHKAAVLRNYEFFGAPTIALRLSRLLPKTRNSRLWMRCALALICRLSCLH